MQVKTSQHIAICALENLAFNRLTDEVNMRYYLVIFSSATIFLALTERLKQSAPYVSIATTGTSCQPKQK
jgi:hypothetical protein